MPDIKISQLPTATTVNDNDIVVINQGGTTKTAARSLIKNAGTVTSITAGTGLTGGTITSTGTLALTTTGVATGTFGTSSKIPALTVDATGRLTAISEITADTEIYYGTSAPNPANQRTWVNTDTAKLYVYVGGAWVEATGVGGVTSVAGKTGVVTLTTSDISGYAGGVSSVAGKTGAVSLTTADISGYGSGQIAPVDIQTFTRGTLYTTTATAFTSGSPTFTVSSAANMVVGMAITAPFLPATSDATQVTITNISGTTITASANATYNYSDRNIPTTIGFATNTYAWTKPAGAKSVDVLCIAGGGGGSSGRVSAGTFGGGGGAGGGLTFRTQIPATLLSATENVVVGLGGIGGTATNQVNSQNVFGADGSHSTFGQIGGSKYNPWVFAAGGGGSNGGNGTSGAASSRNVNTPGSGGAGAAAAAGAAGGSALISAAGGGAGGGANSTSFFNGGNGQWVLGNNPVGGQAVSSGIEGANGSDGTSMNSILHAGGGASGGVGAYTKNAGAGGNGGLYGGGGGGGGCQGTQSASLFSGAGGNGGQGIVVVTTYF